MLFQGLKAIVLLGLLSLRTLRLNIRELFHTGEAYINWLRTTEASRAALSSAAGIRHSVIVCI